MNMAIVLRRQGATNLFRDLVITGLSASGLSQVVLCSGFFQEHFGKNKYQVSQERGLAHVLAKTAAKVVTVGVHNYTWLQAYKNFASSLIAGGVQLDARLAPSFHWHAKVAISSTRRGPVFGAIGSSNLTRPAFSTTSPFNFEADVVLWDRRERGLHGALNAVLSDAEPHSAIRAAYRPGENAGLAVGERLRVLQDEILSAAVNPLEF